MQLRIRKAKFSSKEIPLPYLGRYIERKEVKLAVEDVLKQLDRAPRNASNFSYIVFHGLSGVGKTEAARETARRVIKERNEFSMLYTFSMLLE